MFSRLSLVPFPQRARNQSQLQNRSFTSLLFHAVVRKPSAAEPNHLQSQCPRTSSVAALGCDRLGRIEDVCDRCKRLPSCPKEVLSTRSTFPCLRGARSLRNASLRGAKSLRNVCLLFAGLVIIDLYNVGHLSRLPEGRRSWKLMTLHPTSSSPLQCFLA